MPRFVLGAALLTSALVAASPALVAGQRGQPPAPVGTPAAPTTRPDAAPAATNQVGQPAVADPNKPATGVIRGSVSAAVGGRAIRGAAVNLISAQPVIPGGVTVGPRENRTIATDAQGRFEFKAVPAGRYRIAATKTGYVRLEYGQRAWNQPGTQIELVDGQMVERIDLTMQRGGVIVVTATNPRGEPMAGALVQGLQYRYVNGSRSLRSTVSVETNDLGQARLHGLSPGDYYVTARAPFGNVGSANLKVSYAPTFFPGTLLAQEAQRIPVSISQETSITIPIVRAKLATISGRAVKADGSPIVFTPPAGPVATPPTGLTVGLRQEVPGGGFSTRTVQTKADGSFSVPNLLPGNYELQVRPIGNPAAMRDAAEFTSVPFTIGGDDISNFIVTSRPGAKISGQVYFDTGSPPTDKTYNDLRVFVYTNMAEPALSAGTVTMNPDYSFEITGVAATGMVRLFVANTGWNVKEEIVDGKDIVEAPLTFEPGREYKDMRVTLTQKRAEVTGGAIDGGGRPVKDFVALIFPQDRSRWVPRSLSILVAQSDQNGQFRIQRLPGDKYGAYNVIALESLETDSQWDPELLARLAPNAQKIMLGETEVKNVTLRLQEISR